MLYQTNYQNEKFQGPTTFLPFSQPVPVNNWERLGERLEKEGRSPPSCRSSLAKRALRREEKKKKKESFSLPPSPSIAMVNCPFTPIEGIVQDHVPSY
ncbi:hypothetical protein TNCT_21211 [Trichonephila clavata]|uniref:Uncharacterized protein n=1 Tax=Trichonephila clavata TaxID=2740835 RepID=A0A8X6KQE0_TRICU|nr:hypothetical protein TNCT_21211 [Trichonephila clavata]